MEYRVFLMSRQRLENATVMVDYPIGRVQAGTVEEALFQARVFWPHYGRSLAVSPI